MAEYRSKTKPASYLARHFATLSPPTAPPSTQNKPRNLKIYTPEFYLPQHSNGVRERVEMTRMSIDNGHRAKTTTEATRRRSRNIPSPHSSSSFETPRKAPFQTQRKASNRRPRLARLASTTPPPPLYPTERCTPENLAVPYVARTTTLVPRPLSLSFQPRAENTAAV